MDERASLKDILARTMIKTVPSYANRLFYSLGFLSMICFTVLLVTGIVMVAYGPNWWLTSPTGEFIRSIHLWATQAFVLFMILHLIIVFLTSAYKPPRRLTWVLGALMFFFVLLEAEFGYVLRGDFSSQWRSLQGADLYNGSGIGDFINSLNYKQIYGIHIAAIPLIIMGLLFLHYLLVKMRGIAKPYRKDVPYKMVPANHRLLFLRGLVLILAIVGLAWVFPSPFLRPVTVKEVAQTDPNLMGQTLIAEFDRSSDTATYSDNIDPYRFDTRLIYIQQPYEQLVRLEHTKDLLTAFNQEPAATQDRQLQTASDFFNGRSKSDPKNPLIGVVNALVGMGQSGLYEASLAAADPQGVQGNDTTYVTRFLSDTGVMDARAQALGITTDQYGMLHEETSSFPLGAWWLAPVGWMDHTVLANDDNQDRDGAVILGLLLLLLIAFPYIPYLNRLPDKLKAYRLIWRSRR